MGSRSLQATMGRWWISGVALALLAAGVLFGATSWMSVQVDRQWNAIESIRAAEDIEVHLLEAQRLASLFVRTAASDVAADRDEQWHQLDLALEEAAANLTSEEEARLLDEVRERVRVVREAWAAAGDEISSEEIVGIQRLVSRAVQSSNALNDFNTAYARGARDGARRVNELSNLVTLVLAAVLVGATMLGLRTIRTLLVRPVAEMRAAMVRFGSGDDDARATTEGPIELREIASTFNTTADALVRQRRQQLAFVASVAHDLKNPLNAMRLAAALGRRSPEGALRTMGLFEVQVAQLGRMVDDLLDASRIEAGRLELRPEPVDLGTLADHVVALCSAVSEDHALVLSRPEHPVNATVDPTRITQVLTNLVSNAQKYSPAGSRIEVAVRAHPGEVALSVRDHGPGILPEDQDRIFQAFGRTDEGRALAPGVGLGLFVSRRIVEAHGGRLELRSGVDGSTFEVHLPTAA